MGLLKYVLLWVTISCFYSKCFWVTAEPCKPTQTQTDACRDEGALTSTNDDRDVAWFQTCVTDYYCLQPTKPGQVFKKPQFEEEMRTFTPASYFKYAATRIENFFLRNPDWKTTKSNRDYTANGCVKLLAITEARYLYVTYVLFIKSENKLTACKKDSSDTLFILPAGVCFPRPYGSATCTSDYDVGLIGHSSGILTSAFNQHFSEKFNKPSEEVFDTNVYAYTLEYAMPELFVGMTGYFKNIVPYLDLKPWYQMQELASAYFKMYKFRDSFYKELKGDAEANLGGLGPVKSVPDRNRFFTTFIKKLEKWDETKKGVRDDGTLTDLRKEHNIIYVDRVKEAKDHFDKRENYQEVVRYMSEMSVALVYAAEAYHTRGAMRHVVGDTQMHSQIVKATTTVMDYWVSMIENWADSNKEFEHCSELKVEACLVKMSKYLRRTFHAMKNIYNILSRIPNPGNALKAAKLLQDLEYPTQPDPEVISLKWVSEYRGKEDKKPVFNRDIKPFLDAVGCSEQKEKTALDFDCMKSIQKKVRDFNRVLVSATAKDSAAIQAIFILMPNGKQKTAP